MFITQCVKESKSIIAIHLSGNHIDYYSRIFLRAHLNAEVQYPYRNNAHIQSQIMAHDRTQIIFLNFMIQANLPPLLRPSLQAKEVDMP